MTEAEVILSALIDREAVDPDALARVLDQPEGRALLVDFVRLRMIVSERSQAFPHAERVADLRLSSAATFRRRLSHMRAGWLRVAAILMLLAGGVGGGAWFGQRTSAVEPPPPTNIVEFQRGVDWHLLEPGS